ncbi:zinc-dependent alcohol dehydrogenase family protein [Mycolicibacterium litorale]|nr:zinc-dependent alcohol dehydrogenase family protein [Mycolicibacterium litorale]TDY02183.1 NADPH:quinone reductase-like Zn-dependent oxidoreductase [Mycolicibacterium litorale]
MYMRAAVLTAFGTPLTVVDMPVPAPGPGEVLVQVMASAVNPLDTKVRRGQAAHAQTTPPAVPGIDTAGVVVSVGEDVDRFHPGDEVFGMTGGVGGIQGSLAEYIAVDSRLLAPKPRTLSMRQAAALPLAFITAWEALVDHAAVRQGQQVLVHGGAGGVGNIAVQLATSRGATVYATGSAASQAAIAAAGATAIDYTATPVADYVDTHTGGRGFDVVFDTVGGATLDDSFHAVKAVTGRVVSALGWGSHSLAPLSFRNATYSGVFTLSPLLTGQRREHHGEVLRAAKLLAESGLLTPRLDERAYTLADVDDAYDAVENRTATGKVVIDVGCAAH